MSKLYKIFRMVNNLNKNELIKSIGIPSKIINCQMVNILYYICCSHIIVIRQNIRKRCNNLLFIS